MRSPLPPSLARSYLDFSSARVALVLANALGALVGLYFYLPQLPAWPVYAWPLLVDSPLSLALMAASLLTLVGAASRADYPRTLFTDVLSTVAFASMVKYGLWTAFVLNFYFPLYFPDPVAYFAVLFTHLAMVGEAFLLPYYGRTSRLALGLTLAWFLLNDALDYGIGLHPHLRAADVTPVTFVTVALSLVAVGLAAYCFDRPAA